MRRWGTGVEGRRRDDMGGEGREGRRWLRQRGKGWRIAVEMGGREDRGEREES
jgi:hypothetical protein